MQYDPVKRQLGNVFNRSPFLRKVLYRIPERLRIREAAAYGMVIGIDTTGRVRYNLQDPTGRQSSGSAKGSGG